MTSPLDTSFLRDSTVNSLLALFLGLGSWHTADEWLSIALPVIVGGQRAVAQTTIADLRRALSQLDQQGSQVGLEDVSGAALRGVDPETVYRRPFEQIWRALSGGFDFDTALEQGADRLRSLIETDLQLAATHSVFRGTEGLERVAYRRVPKNNACALCMIASTQYYRSGTLMPIHPGCRCGVRVTLTRNETHVADADLVEAIHEAVAHTFGDDAVNRSAKGYSQYRDLVVVRHHGEYGPTLTKAGDHFDGPAQVKAA